MNTLLSSKELLVKLINTALDKYFTTDNFDISFPIANTGKQNTTVQLTPYVDSGYYGIFDFNYNRIDITDIPRITITKGSAILYSELIDQIVFSGGLSITVPDNRTTEVYENKLSMIDLRDSVIPDLGTNQYIDTVISTIYLSYIFFGELKIRIIP